MKLLFDILYFLLKKMIWVLVIFAAGIILISGLNWVKSQLDTEQKRRVAILEVKQEINNIQEDASEYKDRTVKITEHYKNQRLVVQRLKRNTPSLWNYTDYVIHMQKIRAAERLEEEYASLYRKTIMKNRSLLRPIDKLKNQINNSEQNKSTFIRYFDKAKAFFYSNANQLWSSILVILFSVFCGPTIWKFTWYYFIAPLAKNFAPMRLISSDAKGSIKYGNSENVLSAIIEPGNSLLARMDWVQRYNEQGEKKSQLFFDRSSPFICYAAGLKNLTKITSPEDLSIYVDLAHPKNAQYHISEVKLENHPGIVVYPQNIVALSGNINLKSQWRFFNLHSWLTNQFRYITLYGTGRVYLTGVGIVKPSVPGIDLSLLEHKLLIGFDARLAYMARRTETFLPYLKKYAALTDCGFIGDFPFFYQSVSSGEDKRQLDDHKIWTVLGRFFGL